MKLNVKERLLLLSILPRESDFVTLRIVKNLQTDLSFSEDEVKTYGFKTEAVNGQSVTTWNPSNDSEKEVNMGEKASDVIVEALRKINNEKKLTMEQLELYEKFCK